MKFNEAQLENAIIQSPGEQGYPPVLKGEMEDQIGAYLWVTPTYQWRCLPVKMVKFA